MLYCISCGEPNRDEALYCRRCGAAIDRGNDRAEGAGQRLQEHADKGEAPERSPPLPPPKRAAASASARDPEPVQEASPFDREAYEAVIGPINTQWYLERFQAIHEGRAGVLGWHWPASLVTGWWLLYRKMYPRFVAWLILAVLANIVLDSAFKALEHKPDAADAGVVQWVVWGIVAALIVVPGALGTWLYYKWCGHKIAQAKSDTTTRHELVQNLAQYARHSKQFIAVAAFVSAAVPLAGIVAFFIMPMFVDRPAADHPAQEQASAQGPAAPSKVRPDAKVLPARADTAAATRVSATDASQSTTGLSPLADRIGGWHEMAVRAADALTELQTRKPRLAPSAMRAWVQANPDKWAGMFHDAGENVAVIVPAYKEGLLRVVAYVPYTGLDAPVWLMLVRPYDQPDAPWTCWRGVPSEAEAALPHCRPGAW